MGADRGASSPLVLASAGPPPWLRRGIVCCLAARSHPPSVHCSGIHIQTDKRIDTEVQPLAVAKVLKHIVDQETPDLVLVGKQSIDGDNNQTGTRVPARSRAACTAHANSLALSSPDAERFVGLAPGLLCV